jgi:hypothetical protein
VTRRADLLASLTTLRVVFDDSTDRAMSLSSALVRTAVYDGLPTVFVAPTGASTTSSDEDRVRHGVVDAVHWALHGLSSPVDRIRVAVPMATPAHVMDALATMAHAFLTPAVELATWDVLAGNVLVRPVSHPKPDFDGPRAEDWAKKLGCRDERMLPDLATALASQLGQPPWFRWYRNVTGSYWSGRVAGWEVCTLGDSDFAIRFGETETARASGRAFRSAELADLATAVQAFARLRRDPASRQGRRKLEHLVESGVWAGSVVLRPLNLAKPLAPLVGTPAPPLQMPALFSPDGNARFIDAVLHDGDVPWCVELKVATGGQGEYYRHALTQAVLYREFIRSAVPLHSWFMGLGPGLDASRCEAAIAFPRMVGRAADARTKQLRATARACGVTVIEIDADIDQLRTQILS